MNKAELVRSMASITEMTIKDSESALNALTSTIEKAMESGEKVVISGFGSWEVRQRAARKGVNPRTKESIEIPATKAVRFKVGKTLKECAKV